MDDGDKAVDKTDKVEAAEEAEIDDEELGASIAEAEGSECGARLLVARLVERRGGDVGRLVATGMVGTGHATVAVCSRSSPIFLPAFVSFRPT